MQVEYVAESIAFIERNSQPVCDNVQAVHEAIILVFYKVSEFSNGQPVNFDFRAVDAPRAAYCVNARIGRALEG